MQARIFLLGGGISLIAAAFAMQACGETEPTAAPAADSGTDVTVVDSGQKDAPAEDEDGSACDLSADFTTKIPDASIADGATTSGLCVQCTNNKCAAQVQACNKDCPCQELAGEALDCYLKNPGNPLTCAGNFVGVNQQTQKVGIALLNCIDDKCADECATAQFQDAGPDAH